MCCCFPPKCLKLFIFIASLLVIGVGAVLIWGGYQLLTLPFLQSLGYTFVSYIVIAVGGVLILFSFFGFIGAWKDKKFLLSLFILVAVIIGILLIALGAGLIYARTLSSDYLKTSDTCLKNFKTADDACNQAGQAICHLYCPCKASNSYISEKKVTYQNSNITSQIFSYPSSGASTVLDCDPCIEINRYGNNSVGAINTTTYNYLTYWIQNTIGTTVSASNCNVASSQFKDKYFTSSMLTYFPLLKWVEQSFSCSGLCTVQTFYMFSDVNNGQPGGSCQKQLNDWVQQNFLIFGIVGIIFGVYMILVVFFSCTLCCCAKRKKTDEVIDLSHEKHNKN